MCTPRVEPIKSDSSGACPCSVRGGSPCRAGDQLIAVGNSFPEKGPQVHVSVLTGGWVNAAGTPNVQIRAGDSQTQDLPILYSKDPLFFGQEPCSLCFGPGLL